MIISKQSVDFLARMDAIDHDSCCYSGTGIPQKRYDTLWLQELYEQYFWNNLRDLRGEGVIYGGVTK